MPPHQRDTDCRNEPTVLVGSKYHLCSSCAMLKEFCRMGQKLLGTVQEKSWGTRGAGHPVVRVPCRAHKVAVGVDCPGNYRSGACPIREQRCVDALRADAIRGFGRRGQQQSSS